jgi:hypothetical protein
MADMTTATVYPNLQYNEAQYIDSTLNFSDITSKLASALSSSYLELPPISELI